MLYASCLLLICKFDAGLEKLIHAGQRKQKILFSTTDQRLEWVDINKYQTQLVLG